MTKRKTATAAPEGVEGGEADAGLAQPAELAAAMAARRYRTQSLRSLVPYARNSRTHSPNQIATIKGLLMEYGWTRPIAIADDVILAGHGVTIAALELANDGKCPPGWPDPWSAPVVDLSHFSQAQRRAYVIADNRAAELSGWDKELLAMELGELREDGFALDLTGWAEPDLRTLLGDDPTMGKEPPDEFGAVDETISTEHQCPSCGYAWSGKSGAGRPVQKGDDGDDE